MSIGNCPRCGAETDDENDLCYQCALRRVNIELAEIDFTPSLVQSLEFWRVLRCDECGHELPRDLKCTNPDCSAKNGYGLG
jgi:hypothetical protein